METPSSMVDPIRSDSTIPNFDPVDPGFTLPNLLTEKLPLNDTIQLADIWGLTPTEDQIPTYAPARFEQQYRVVANGGSSVVYIYDASNQRWFTGSKPTYVSGTDSKTTSDASTTQNIAHGLGKIPLYVRITATVISTVAGATSFHQAIAVYNGSVQSSNSVYGAFNAIPTCDNLFRLGTNDTTGGSNYQTGFLGLDSTNISIAWTKTGSPVGTYQLLWEAYA